MIRGLIRGKTIELDDETGLPEGQVVAVTVRPLAVDHQDSPAREGLKRAFGGWSDDPAGLSDYLEWNRRQRKMGRTESRT